jgi:thiol-disulfide isomerase/thioredoxin
MSKTVLYFTASWCGPCQQIKPIYKKCLETHQNISFHMIDVDDSKNKTLLDTYGIESMPTFIFLHNNRIVGKINGADSNKLIVHCNNLATA